jgi:hypothetical protein
VGLGSGQLAQPARGDQQKALEPGGWWHVQTLCRSILDTSVTDFFNVHFEHFGHKTLFF